VWENDMFRLSRFPVEHEPKWVRALVKVGPP
jgi:hypothetical protein